MWLTIVDPATGILQIKEIPALVSMDKTGFIHEVFDVTEPTSRPVYEAWLCHCPQPRYIIYNNEANSNYMPAMVKNPQMNANFKCAGQCALCSGVRR